MICYNVPLFASRQDVPDVEAKTVGAAGAQAIRLSSCRRGWRWGLILATLLHLLGVGVGLMVVRQRALPDAQRSDALTMLFAAPSSGPQAVMPGSEPTPKVTAAPTNDAGTSADVASGAAQPSPPVPPVQQALPDERQKSDSAQGEQPSAPAAADPAPMSLPQPMQAEAVPKPAAQAPTVHSRIVHQPGNRAVTHSGVEAASGAAVARPAPAAAQSGGTPSANQPSAAPNPQWRAALAAWLVGHKTYPMAARQRGEEGTIVVRFSIDPSGRVTAVSIVRGSGFATLDQAAGDMLRGATLPAPTNATTVSVQLHYTLAE